MVPARSFSKLQHKTFKEDMVSRNTPTRSGVSTAYAPERTSMHNKIYLDQIFNAERKKRIDKLSIGGGIDAKNKRSFYKIIDDRLHFKDF